jgi:hypothetical protein
MGLMKYIIIIISLLFISCAQESESAKSLFNAPTSTNNNSYENIITSFIEPADATYADGGGTLLFQVNFSEPVNIAPTSRLILNIGGSIRYATYSSGDGTSGIEFSYAIQAGDNDSDGVELVISQIDLQGGILQKVSDSTNISSSFASYLDSMTGVLVDTSSGITAPNQVTGVTTAPTTAKYRTKCSMVSSQ